MLGKYPQDCLASAFAWLHDEAALRLPAGELSSLLVDGIIPGVGAVVVFVPVIMILMGCIAFLEDTGYMARAAFIMDRLMHLMGLHGKSFIPLIMGTGCNVPALQATRTIEARTDRFITILVTPLISCSARLQVYILIAGTFFPPFRAALAIIAMHVLGFGLAMVVGKVLRLTLFRGASTPFVMELPPYRMPVLSATAVHMWEKGRVFLTRAGTVILAGATLVWFLSHYPGIANVEWAAAYQQQQQAVRAMKLAPDQEKQQLETVDLAHEKPDHEHQPGRTVRKGPSARAGADPRPGPHAPRGLEGRRRPHGGLRRQGDRRRHHGRAVHQAEARGGEPGRRQSPLQVALRRQSGLTPLTALAFMVFTLIYTPCLGTVGMILKETRSANGRPSRSSTAWCSRGSWPGASWRSATWPGRTEEPPVHIQGLIVLAFVALAAAFLAWRVVGPFVGGSSSSGCHGCSTPCEMKTTAKRKPCAEPSASVRLHVVKTPIPSARHLLRPKS